MFKLHRSHQILQLLRGFYLVALIISGTLVLCSAAVAEKPAAKKHPPVEVFLTDWCPYCQKTEEFLKQHSVKYERVNIERSRDGYNTYKTLGGGGIPIVKIGSNIIHGFDEGALREALSIKAE